MPLLPHARRSLQTTTAAAAATLALGAAVAAPASAEVYDLYLIAGQSNAYGNSGTFAARKNDLFSNGQYPELAPQLTPFSAQTPDVRWAFQFPERSLGGFNAPPGANTPGRLNIPAVDPTPGFVNLGLIGGTGGVVVTGPNGNATSQVIGPELGLGNTLLDQAGAASPVPALASFAVGGRPLFDLPGVGDFNPNNSETHDLYNDMIGFYAGLVSGLEARGHTVNVKGLAWVQGERDAKTAPPGGGGAAIDYGDYNNDGHIDGDDAEDAYFDNLQALIAGFRTEFGAGLQVVLPNLNIDSAATFAAYGSEYLNDDEINEAQARVAALDGLVSVVDTSNTNAFVLADDGLHYDALGQINLGISIANAFEGTNAPLILVPEPTSAALLALAGLAGMRRRRRV